jgi:hypothetical protein
MHNYYDSGFFHFTLRILKHDLIAFKCTGTTVNDGALHDLVRRFITTTN